MTTELAVPVGRPAQEYVEKPIISASLSRPRGLTDEISDLPDTRCPQYSLTKINQGPWVIMEDKEPPDDSAATQMALYVIPEHARAERGKILALLQRETARAWKKGYGEGFEWGLDQGYEDGAAWVERIIQEEGYDSFREICDA